MQLAAYLELLRTSQLVLAESYRAVAQGHEDDAEVYYTCRRFADACADRARALDPIVARHEQPQEPEPARLHPHAVDAHRAGLIGLLRDLQDLDQLANLVQTTSTVVGQAAHAVRDRELIALAGGGERDITAQIAWLRARIRSLAPQALIATSSA